MFLKIGIIGAILLIGVIVFSSEIQEFFPNTSTNGVDSLKSDVKTLTSNSMDSVEQKVDSSINHTKTKLDEIKIDSSKYIEEKISNKITFLNSSN